MGWPTPPSSSWFTPRGKPRGGRLRRGGSGGSGSQGDLHRGGQGRDRQEAHRRQPGDGARAPGQAGDPGGRGPRRGEPAHDARASGADEDPLRLHRAEGGEHRRGGHPHRDGEPRAGLGCARSPRCGQPAHAQKMRLLRHVQELDATSPSSTSAPARTQRARLLPRLGPRPVGARSRADRGRERYRFIKAAFWRRMRNVAQVCTGTSRLLRSVMGRGTFRSPVELVETVSEGIPRRGEPRPPASSLPSSADGEPGPHRPGRRGRGARGRRLAEVLRAGDGLPRLRRSTTSRCGARCEPRRALSRTSRSRRRSFATIVDRLGALDIAGASLGTQ